MQSNVTGVYPCPLSNLHDCLLPLGFHVVILSTDVIFCIYGVGPSHGTTEDGEVGVANCTSLPIHVSSWVRAVALILGCSRPGLWGLIQLGSSMSSGKDSSVRSQVSSWESVLPSRLLTFPKMTRRGKALDIW